MRKNRVGRSFLAVALALACWATSAGVASTTEELQSIAHGNSAFALELYAALHTRQGNLFFSPYSLSAALAMAYAGARTDTEAQIARVMRFDLPQHRLHPAFSHLRDELKVAAGSEACRLSLANALWAQQGHEFLEEYSHLTHEQYDAGVQRVDFEQAPEQARRTINTWVADRTEGRIDELLQAADLKPAVALVLTNAIYFEGSWASPFDPRHTQAAPFRISPRERLGVPMMQRIGRFGFASLDALEIIELPYAGDRLSLVILLPKAVDGLAALESSLDATNLQHWLGQLRAEDVRVSLPRLEIESRFDLTSTLQAMGMSDAFSPTRADFSGMTGTRELFISMLIHQARMEVREEGTAAAAGSALVLKKGPQPTPFAADHPFLFLVRDRQSGSILFMGRVVNPAS